MDYAKLIKRLRRYVEIEREEHHAADLEAEAADAIEELSAAVSGFEATTDVEFVKEDGHERIRFVPKWVSVKERLPEEGVSVQVCFRSQGGIAQAVSERFVNDRNQSYWSGLCGMKPTHWMPLPSTEGLNET